MSLILEALRKLDREKQVPERGFLVMAPAAWPSSRGARQRWTWIVVAAVAGALGAAALLGRGPRKQNAESPAPLPPAPARAAAPVATLGQPRPAAASLLPPVTLEPAPPMTIAAAAVAAPVAAPTTAPRAAPAAALAGPALVLQAITERDGQPVVLINDRLLREGDEIEGARIVKIGDTFVEIDYQGRRTALRF